MDLSLKTIREQKQLTQTEVALKAGISLRAYQNYEANLRVPNVYVATAIAKALKSSVETLFKIPQRQLRENDAQANCTTPDRDLAAARLADVPSETMILAAQDLEDGHADTDEGRKVLNLAKAVCGPALV